MSSVYVRFDDDDLVYQKAVKSANDSGGCVAVATDDKTGSICVRDTKEPKGNVHRYTRTQWNELLDGVKRGAVAANHDPGTEEILLSDPQQPRGSIQRYTRIEWEAFSDGARKGEFDHL